MALKKRQAFKIMKFYLRHLGVNPNETRREAVYRFFGYRQRLKEKFVNEKVSDPDTPLKDGGTVLND